MFRRVLIANRGEIAVRIIRACRELEIETVAVYSVADRDALHVQLATRAVCIGPARAAESYLNQAAILTAAVETGCDAVHPGYGFLSENPDFADLCAKCGLKFIGPSGDVIRQMGSKAAAKALMRRSGVPVVPGSEGAVDLEEARRVADEVGYPVLVKASAGGGGRGMRRVDRPEDLPALFQAAQSEAVACFGNGELYVEKLILHPRHIEFQILADSQGNVIHLGERDCSIQRKNQKLIEESPSRALTPQLREEMGQAAVRAARAAGYESAGTIEFVLDEDGRFYFIEMNTRIQVEHPVTEFVTGAGPGAGTAAHRGGPAPERGAGGGPAVRLCHGVPHQRGGPQRRAFGPARDGWNSSISPAGPGFGWTLPCSAATRCRPTMTPWCAKMVV